MAVHDSRATRAKLNMMTTLLNQLISTVCGIVIPRVMIGAFGSVIYGATTSIAQFLSYISLLENGMGRVARGALYRPLADGNEEEVSKVHQEITSFFRRLSVVFVGYTLIIALAFPYIADLQALSKTYIFGLVVVISISTLAKYVGGLSNLTLLNADQKQYITNSVTLLTTVLNTILIVILVDLKGDVLLVKLSSGLVFTLRPLIFTACVKKSYRLPKVPREEGVLNQKWTGMGQHLAYFIHTNTDVVLLTLFADLKMVAVYSVYSLVINSIRNIANSFAGGMEAIFGNMIAKNEMQQLRKTYQQYRMLLSSVSILLFSITAAMIVPFVRLYTKGISDADYIQPAFALTLLLAEALNCMSLPCSTLPISANQLRESKWGAYGEAVINVGLTCILIFWNPLLGVALGTLAATAFKSIYYLYYSEINILKDGNKRFWLPYIRDMLFLVLLCVLGMTALMMIEIEHFVLWCVYALAVSASIGLLMLVYMLLFQRRDMKPILNMILKKIKH